jgi:hypothetical protein
MRKVVIRDGSCKPVGSFVIPKHQTMTTNISLHNYLAPLARFQRAASPLYQDHTIAFTPMNCFELVIHTQTAQDKYLIEEKDDTFHISKYRRHFLGFWSYKKIAQAKSQEDALKIIHILTPDTILDTEVLAGDSCLSQWN